MQQNLGAATTKLKYLKNLPSQLTMFPTEAELAKESVKSNKSNENRYARRGSCGCLRGTLKTHNYFSAFGGKHLRTEIT